MVDARAPRPSAVGIGLSAVASLAVLAGGVIHLQEWLETYKDLPSSIPGVEVVKYGFPLNAVGSVAMVALLAVALFKLPKFTLPAILANTAFQAGSLAALILSRSASLFGWQERGYQGAPGQTLAVEVVALIALVVLGVQSLRGDDPTV